MKKILSAALALVICLCAMLALTSCTDKKKEKKYDTERGELDATAHDVRIDNISVNELYYKYEYNKVEHPNLH